MATLKDIAIQAGVSATTVSKALRGSTDINKETKEIIFRLAEELEYKPKHEPIRTVSKLNCNRIGVIYNGSDVFILPLQKSLSSAGYELLLMMRNVTSDAPIEPMMRQLSAETIGMICEDDLGRSLGSYIPDIPVVIIGPNMQSDHYDVVMVDEQAGYRQAINHLVGLGHRKIGFIGDRFYSVRLSYVQAELAHIGLNIPEKYILFSMTERHSACGYKLAEQYLKMEDPPTAIIAQYDDVAIGALRRFHEAGLTAPRDFSIIGFDASLYGGYQIPPLATIDDMYQEQADIAADILKKKLCNTDYTAIQTVFVKAQYIPRESVGVPRSTLSFFPKSI